MGLIEVLTMCFKTLLKIVYMCLYVLIDDYGILMISIQVIARPTITLITL